MTDSYYRATDFILPQPCISSGDPSLNILSSTTASISVGCHKDMISSVSKCYGLLLYPSHNASPILLHDGINLIGRSLVPHNEISCIPLESPTKSISRQHAVIEVPLGEGNIWIHDCGSRNGTIIFQTGMEDDYPPSRLPDGAWRLLGTTLIPNRYYQLQPGNYVIFGDVGARLICLDTPPAAKVTPITSHSGALHALATSSVLLDATSPAFSTHKRSENEEMITPEKRSYHSLKSTPSPSKRSFESFDPITTIHHFQESQFPNSPLSSSFTILGIKADEGVSSSISPQAISSPRQSEKNPRMELTNSVKKRKIMTGDEESSPSMAFSASKSVLSPISDVEIRKVAISGIGNEGRLKVLQGLKLAGIKLVENVSEADLLIVAPLPTRTPKFLIAMSRGIPITTTEHWLRSLKSVLPSDVKHAKQGGRKKIISPSVPTDSFVLTQENFLPHIPSLTHGGKSWNGPTLRATLQRRRLSGKPLLHDTEWVIEKSIPSETQRVVKEIILGAGGSVVKSLASNSSVLASIEDIERLYYSILTAK